jgi:hypothetical protein
MKSLAAEGFKASLGQGSATVRLTWTRFPGTLVIQRLEHRAWANFRTADGNAGFADDAESTYPDPVAYRVRRLKSSDWQELVVAAGEFTIFQMPDEHSRNQQTSTRTFNWLLKNFTAFNGKLIVFPGDLITEPKDKSQWNYVVHQLERFKNVGIPLFLTPGNHDWSDGCKRHWNTRLKPGFWHPDPAQAATFETMLPNDTFNTAMRWDFGLLKLVFIGMAANLPDHGGSWTEQHQWALSVAQKYSDHIAIIVTHAYLNSNGTLQKPQHEHYLYGDQIWAETVMSAPNIMQVMCGHTHTPTMGWWHFVHTGVNGNRVDALNIDTQEFPNGGDDYVRIYRWKPDQKRIEASTIQVTAPNSYVTLAQVPPIRPGNEASFTIPITAPDQCSRTLPIHSCQSRSSKDFRSHSR